MATGKFLVLIAGLKTDLDAIKGLREGLLNDDAPVFTNVSNLEGNLVVKKSLKEYYKF